MLGGEQRERTKTVASARQVAVRESLRTVVTRFAEHPVQGRGELLRPLRPPRKVLRRFRQQPCHREQQKARQHSAQHEDGRPAERRHEPRRNRRADHSADRYPDHGDRDDDGAHRERRKLHHQRGDVWQCATEPQPGKEPVIRERRGPVRGGSQQRGRRHQRHARKQRTTPAVTVSRDPEHERADEHAEQPRGEDGRERGAVHVPVRHQFRRGERDRLDVEAVEHQGERREHGYRERARPEARVVDDLGHFDRSALHVQRRRRDFFAGAADRVRVFRAGGSSMSASTRSGLPDPCRILSGGQTITAPVGGSRSRFVRHCSP